MFDRFRLEREIELLSEAPRLAQLATRARPASPVRTAACKARLKEAKVAIVGGGLAGLTAALELAKDDVKVTLYEGRPALGGRVVSSKSLAKGRIIELGAELIGSFHTSFLKLARRYKLSMVSRVEADLYDRQDLRVRVMLGAKEPSNNEYLDLSDDLDDILEKIADFADGLKFDETQPWLDSSNSTYDGETVEHALLQRFNVKKHYYPRPGVMEVTPLWRMLELLLVNDEVAQLADMNFLGLLCKVKGGQDDRPGRPFNQTPEHQKQRKMGYWHELEIFRCAEGCGTLVERMEKELKKLKVRINLRTAVTNIHLTDGGVLIGSRKAAKDGSIEMKGLPVFAPYDYVIFTSPPTVWDLVSISEGGTLSKDKLKVSGGKPVDLKVDPGVIRSGPAIKMFTVAPQRFWLSEKQPAAPYGGTSKLGQIWEGTDNQTKTGPSQEAVLSVFAGPLIATPMQPGGMAFRAPTKAECVAELRRLYPASYPKGADPAYVNWPNAPFIKTGYASPGKNQVMTIGQKLAQPFKRRLFFAGEHTDMAFFGYMEGAIRSGERAAAQLAFLACAGVSSPPSRGSRTYTT